MWVFFFARSFSGTDVRNHVKIRISCDVQNSILHAKKKQIFIYTLNISAGLLQWYSFHRFIFDYHQDALCTSLVDIPIIFQKLSTILWRHKNAYVWALDGDTWHVSVWSKSPLQTGNMCSFGSVRAVWNGVDVEALERLDAPFG